MATIGSLALAIRAQTDRLKTDLAPALAAIKDWGKAALAAGADAKEVDKAMARMRQEALAGAKAQEAHGNSLQRVKQGMAAVTGAVSALSSEMGGALGHATRLGGSLIQSFLAGGPVALGVTAVAAGISAIAGNSAEAEEAIKKAKEQTHEWATKGAEELEDLKNKLQGIRDAKTEIEGGPKAAEVAALRAPGQAIAKIEAEMREKKAQIERWVAEFDELAGSATDETGPTRSDRNEMAKRTAWIEGARQRLTLLEQEKQAQLEILNAEIERMDAQGKANAAAANEKREMEAGSEAARAMADHMREVKEAQEESVRLAGELASLTQKGSIAALEMADHYRQVQQEQEKAITDLAKSELVEGLKNKQVADEEKVDQEKQAAKKADAAAGFLKSLQEENELLKAGSDFARKRIEIDRELSENIKKAGGDVAAIEAARELHQTKRAMLAGEEAEAAKKKAEQEAKATEELRKQNALALVKRNLDVTKGFKNFSGTSVFGFGAGQAGTGIGDIGGAAAAAIKGATPFGGAGQGAAPAPQGGGAAQGKQPQNIAPEIEALAKQIEAWAANEEKTAAAITKASAATRAAFDRGARAMEKAVGSLGDDVRALDQRVRAMEERAQRAASTGVGPA